MYSDINNRRQNLTLKLLSTINNIKSATTAISDTIVPIITYYSTSHLIPLNDWEDPFYFPVRFPTLVLFGNSGHLGYRQQPVSIKA